AHVGESDLRSALAVLSRIAPPGDAGSIGVDQEEADAVAVAPVAAEPRGDDQPVGAVALADQPFLAVQHEGAAVLAGAQRDVMEVVTGLPFGLRESEPQLARGELADQLGPTFGTRAVLD